MRRKAVFLLAAPSLACAAGCAAGRPDAPARTATLESAPLSFAVQDGRRVAYKVAGRGEPALVFVHGWACDMTSFRFQVPVFAKTHRVIAIDLPGHGASDKPEIVYSMDLFARAIDAVLKDAGVARAVLVGHSLGTPVVRQFYRLMPGKTVALVAVDGALKPYTLDPAAVERFLAPFAGPGVREAQTRMVDSMFTPPDADLAASVKTVALATPPFVVVSAGRAMFDPAIWREDPIAVPLLVVLAQSPFWNSEYEAFVRKLAPGVRYELLHGVGHFLMLQKPDEFNKLLAAFLAGLTKPA
ncbi:MAG: alpha/beta fold hydrolase [Thermoanaerobaculia bacterium]